MNFFGQLLQQIKNNALYLSNTLGNIYVPTSMRVHAWSLRPSRCWVIY